MIVPDTLRQSIHMEHAAQIVPALGPLTSGTAAAPPEHFLFLCFTNRCGSNHLAALLAKTYFFNEPGEFFNADTVLFHARTLKPPSLRAYVAHLPSLVAVNGWVAAKASVDQLMMLTDAGILAGLLPHSRFILLERRDRVGQAISRCIAAQTGRWTTAHPSRIPETELRYSRADIDAEITRITLATYGFYSFFAANGLAPVHLFHEDILADPQAAMAAIGQSTGQPALATDPAAISLRPQANAINAAWRARYETERAS